MAIMMAEPASLKEAPPGTILTHSGIYVDPLDLKKDQVRIEDIAHGLSQICRFVGQCDEFFSVAEHSIEVALTLPPRLRLPGLMHDAAEAYIGDIPSPVKRRVSLLSFIENNLLMMIFSAYEIPWPDDAAWEEIKRVDTLMLQREASMLFKCPAGGSVDSSEVAKTRFLALFWKCGGYKSSLREEVEKHAHP